MPSRQNVKQVPSDEVQGEGSWIKVRPYTVAQHNRRVGLLRRAQAAETEAETQAVEAELWALFAEVVVGWNWVDDEGKPLPKPSDTGVYELLTMPEMQFIGNAVQEASTLTGEKKAN